MDISKTGRIQGLRELRTKFRLGGTFRGLYRGLGGPIRGYTTNLVQGLRQVLWYKNDVQVVLLTQSKAYYETLGEC